MCDTCSTCGPKGAINAQIVLPVHDPATGAGQKYVFKAKRPLKVTQRVVGDTIEITYELAVSSPPVPTLTVAPAVVEIGQTFNALFTAALKLGSDPIKLRTVTPEDYVNAPQPLPNNFTFAVNNIHALAAGPIAAHTYTVTDEENVKASATASVQVQHRFFILYSTNRVLTAAELQAAMDGQQGQVAATIKAAYGAMRPYPVPAGPQKHFIHFLYPEGQPGVGQPLDEYGSPLPIAEAAETLPATNRYGLELRYRVATTSYSYGQFTFNFQF